MRPNSLTRRLRFLHAEHLPQPILTWIEHDLRGASAAEIERRVTRDYAVVHATQQALRALKAKRLKATPLLRSHRKKVAPPRPAPTKQTPARAAKPGLGQQPKPQRYAAAQQEFSFVVTMRMPR